MGCSHSTPLVLMYYIPRADPCSFSDALFHFLNARMAEPGLLGLPGLGLQLGQAAPALPGLAQSLASSPLLPCPSSAPGSPASPAFSLPTPCSSTSPVASPSSSAASLDQEAEEDRRPHQCMECLKRFRFKSNLFEHKTLHQRTTPFVCPFCAKTCRLKGNLKKHLQIHVASAEQLEELWKARFSRSSGRPRKHPQQQQPELQQQQLPAPLARRPEQFGDLARLQPQVFLDLSKLVCS